MDEREQRRHWTTNERISTSPSPDSSSQAASPTAGESNNGPSIRCTMGRHPGTRSQSTTLPPHDWGSSGRNTSLVTHHGKDLGMSSQIPRPKRRRSSSFHGGERQGYQGAERGRDHHPPPARRQKVAPQLENNTTSSASSAIPTEAMIARRASRSLSPQRYRTPRGEMDNTSSIRRSEGLPNSNLHRNLEDVLMRSASPPQAVERDSKGCVEAPDEQAHPPSRQGDRDWSHVDGHHVQDPAMATPFSPPQSSGDAHQKDLPVHNHGATYNIASAGNVFKGINNGTVYMESVTVTYADDFMINLADRLKVCVRADHLYADDDETALRHDQCTPGTRIEILSGVMNWASNMSPTCERVYWLSGQAGAGKTTIAYTIAHQLETLASIGGSKVILGGSFFCSRQFVGTQAASSIIRTIVYQLALRSKPFQIALKMHGKFETVNHGPRSQLMGLLITPWEKSAPQRLAVNEPCYVIPIDALDELKGTGSTDFLGTLFDVVNQQDLSGLKFFVTSRSEPALVKQILTFPNKRVCRLEEVSLEESSADIKLYLDQSLGECATSSQIHQLVADAAGLFIYAAMVVGYMKGRDLEEQRSLLKRLLSPSFSTVCRPPHAATATLDDLYLQVLETCLVDPRERNDPEAFRDCLFILHTFLCTIERTSTSLAVEILNASHGDGDTTLDAGMARGVLHRLHSVLYSQGGQVMTYHKSFADFLFDEHRSRKFFCNKEQHHCRLANGCFQIMAEQLRFNIANIPSSYHMDCDNSTLATSIDTNILAPLRYACGNWSTHLSLTTLEALHGFAEAVDIFLQLRVLFWMELMNLLGWRGHCQGMLHDTQCLFSRYKGAAKLVSRLADATAFAAYHGPSKAALSTPHLYLSSLATFPRHSTMVQNWRHQFGGIPGFISAHGVHSEALVANIPLKDKVNALSVSPDGVNVAVGSYNRLLQIWDVSTGEEVRTLKGHTGPVYAVAYSPDGTHVASGSEDKSVWVWDVGCGMCL